MKYISIVSSLVLTKAGLTNGGAFCHSDCQSWKPSGMGLPWSAMAIYSFTVGLSGMAACIWLTT